MGLPLRRIPSNEYKRKKKYRKSPLEYHRNNCHRQNPYMNDKNRGKTLRKNSLFLKLSLQNIY